VEVGDGRRQAAIEVERAGDLGHERVGDIHRVDRHVEARAGQPLGQAVLLQQRGRPAAHAMVPPPGRVGNRDQRDGGRSHVRKARRWILQRTMSPRNVEVVRAMYAALARRDRATLLSHLDPAIRVYDRPVHPEASVYEGREGFLRFAETDWDAFDEVTYEPQEFLARGAYVVVPIKQGGTGKGSALGVEERIVNVWKLRGGKCVELRNYSTLGEALEAVGPGE
jgi:ketosteroid isomerase-like protein